ncbi:MAG: hypothetical protein K6A73_00855 [Bacteroidales bacterium]|nr:hypothetical protein [Bacteroidales bacterium]
MTIDIKVPKGWSDLDIRQLAIVAKLIDLDLDRRQLLLVSFCTLSGIRIRHSARGLRYVYNKQEFKLEPYQLSEFCNRMEWLIDERPVDIVNPTKIHPHLIDVKFGSYFYADAMMSRYGKTGKPRFVRKALKELGQGCLFMSKHKASIVQLWWNGVQGYLQKIYPLVFPSSDDKNKNTQSPFTILQNLLLMLNENRPQDNRLIEDADAHGVLAALNNKIDQYEKMKERIKK